MRWDCKRNGCFNLLMRPKIEVFDDCFYGRGAMGDVDGLFERNEVNNELNNIRQWLAFNLGSWRDFAKCANVPYSTLERVARGTTKNPRLATYTKIRNEWMRRTGQIDDSNSVKEQ